VRFNPIPIARHGDRYRLRLGDGRIITTKPIDPETGAAIRQCRLAFEDGYESMPGDDLRRVWRWFEEQARQATVEPPAADAGV
jgi:hypothetical protein